MKPIIMTTLRSIKSIDRSPFRLGFLLIPLALACLSLSPKARAVTPAPDGGYPGFTTAEGTQALQSLSTGAGNTGVGWRALFADTTASFNTGLGAGALLLNQADSNTAVGAVALLLNTTGTQNTAVGTDALGLNDSANNNTAVGAFALQTNDDSGNGLANGNTGVGSEALRNNIKADNNTAVGFAALNSNDSTGSGMAEFNDAVGSGALLSNTDGHGNNAFGESALFNNQTASENTAIGDIALALNDSSGSGNANNNVAVGGAALIGNVDGSENTAVGTGTGPNIVAGVNNTYLGDFVAYPRRRRKRYDPHRRPLERERGGSLACFIGGIFANGPTVLGGNIVEVTLDLSNDQLGWTIGPSQRAPSVPSRGAPAQRGKPQQPAGRPQHQAMLNDKVDKLQVVIQMQQRQIVALTAQLKEQAENFTAQLKEQATQIQKVSAQLEASRPAQQVVNNP